MNNKQEQQRVMTVHHLNNPPPPQRSRSCLLPPHVTQAPANTRQTIGRRGRSRQPTLSPTTTTDHRTCAHYRHNCPASNHHRKAHPREEIELTLPEKARRVFSPALSLSRTLSLSLSFPASFCCAKPLAPEAFQNRFLRALIPLLWRSRKPRFPGANHTGTRVWARVPVGEAFLAAIKVPPLDYKVPPLDYNFSGPVQLVLRSNPTGLHGTTRRLSLPPLQCHRPVLR